MTDKRALPQMMPPLQTILRAELARGNRIASIGDWPPHCQLFVMLERPFHKTYRAVDGIIYADVNDRHYWKAEYRTVDGSECLACGF